MKTQFNRFERIYQQWIDDERIYLLKRIEKLENDNRELHQIYQTYEKSLQSITNLIIKILLIQQVNLKNVILTYLNILLFSPEEYATKYLADLIANISCSLIDTCLLQLHLPFFIVNVKI